MTTSSVYPVFARWPDGFMCPIGEVPEFSHRSDDYERVLVTEFDEEGEPLQWNRLP